ncbi:MAG: hypothetical protein EBR28_13235 [Planctomycetia bacterium]|nr:hypothetical protein [Planctomycetia bacterium]
MAGARTAGVDMIIERIEIDRFGALADVAIHGLDSGVEVLHGTNETGKTSLLEFVRGVFFGFGGLFRRGVLDPNRPCGGRLVARAGLDARRIAIERRHDGPHIDRLTAASYEAEDELPVADRIAVVDAEEAAGPPLFLRDFIGEIDERTFTAVMAFGLDELHELRTLDADGCGSRLYELASGLDRSKVALVLANLRSAVERLDSADPEISPIESLRQRRSAALARLAAMNAPAIDAGAAALELARIDADLAACEARAADARALEAKVRALLPLAPLHAERRRAADALADLEAKPAIHADFDAWELASKHRDHLARLARRRKRVRGRVARELAALPSDPLVRKKRAAIVAVCDDQPRGGVAGRVGRAAGRPPLRRGAGSHRADAARRAGTGRGPGAGNARRIAPADRAHPLPRAAQGPRARIPSRDRRREGSPAAGGRDARQPRLDPRLDRRGRHGTADRCGHRRGRWSRRTLPQPHRGRRPGRRTRRGARPDRPRGRRQSRRTIAAGGLAHRARGRLRARRRTAPLGAAAAGRRDRFPRLRPGHARAGWNGARVGCDVVARPVGIGAVRCGPPAAGHGAWAAD